MMPTWLRVEVSLTKIGRVPPQVLEYLLMDDGKKRDGSARSKPSSACGWPQALSLTPQLQHANRVDLEPSL